MNTSKKRLLYVGIFLVLLFCLLLTRYYEIQIVEGDKWSFEARKQHYFIIKEPFTRGIFYSNSAIKKGHPEKAQKLVVDIEKFHLYIDPETIPDKRKKEIASKLIKTLDLPKSEIKTFWQQFLKKSHSRKLSMWLDIDIKDSILEWWNPYAKKYKIPRNALFFISDFQRSYPFGKLLGQVLHTIQNTKDEKTQQSYPTGGLELYFDRYLKGKLGKKD